MVGGSTANGSTAKTRIERLDFTRTSIESWHDPDGKHRSWPIVYTLSNSREVYVGESMNALGRMHQHLDSGTKSSLRAVRIMVNDEFNKSACLDLESYLIRLFSGDGAFQVLNRNAGVVDANYFDRARYQETFKEIFEQLRAEGLFDKRIAQIENSDLFKLSPFKALNDDQAIAVEDIVEGFLDDLEANRTSTAVVEGSPGTGKTIVAIYLLKLLTDIRERNDHDNPDAELLFSDFFVEGSAELLEGRRFGLVIPQQSLRTSVQNVFAKTPGLSKAMVLSAFDVAKDPEQFDLLVVDESHRLAQYGPQANGALVNRFEEINRRFARAGEDWELLTQIDWIVRKSRHQVFLVDEGQGVRPIDIPIPTLASMRSRAKESKRHYLLRSQMRVLAGGDYLGYVRDVLSDEPPSDATTFQNYDLRFFDDAREMRDEIVRRDQEHGLSRLVAGYAWKWRSKKNPTTHDIDLDGMQLFWNRSDTDWINSPGSLDEVGSIHTVQGYDLNYAGVVIGRELYLDPVSGLIRLDRSHYFDTRGKSNMPSRGITVTDDDVLALVKNVYAVLLSRGMRGTYVYVCDPALREHLRPYFSAAARAGATTQELPRA